MTLLTSLIVLIASVYLIKSVPSPGALVSGVLENGADLAETLSSGTYETGLEGIKASVSTYKYFFDSDFVEGDDELFQKLEKAPLQVRRVAGFFLFLTVWILLNSLTLR